MGGLRTRGGLTPDLFTFGKVIGGGLPTAAVAGREEVMAHLSPTGPVYHAGTLSGNPVAMAAGAATLENATSEVYTHIDKSAQVVANALTAALTDAGVDHSVQKVGSLFSVAFGTSAQGVHNYSQAQAQQSFRYGPFFHAMLEAGSTCRPVCLRRGSSPVRTTRRLWSRSSQPCRPQRRPPPRLNEARVLEDPMRWQTQRAGCRQPQQRSDSAEPDGGQHR